MKLMDYSADILGKYQVFVTRVLANLQSMDIDVGAYELDHIAYRATTEESFSVACRVLPEVATQVSRKVIRDRYVDIWKLNEPLHYENREIVYLEILAPAVGDQFYEGLEHAEFVVNDRSLQVLVVAHPELTWNLNSLNREPNPEIGLKFDDGVNVKFHMLSIAKVIELEKSEL